MTFFKLDEAAAFMIVRPTRVDPVNATFSIFMCDEMAAPATFPYPVMMLTTPGGKTLAMRVAAKRAESGVSSDVLMTMQFPVARAGPSYHEGGQLW